MNHTLKLALVLLVSACATQRERTTDSASGAINTAPVPSSGPPSTVTTNPPVTAQKPTMCTMEARPALQVAVTDATGAPLLSAQVRVIAIDGAYADTSRVIMGGADVASVPLAYERPGTYKLEVYSRDVLNTTLTDVRVVKTQDGCHVETQQVTARLRG